MSRRVALRALLAVLIAAAVAGCGVGSGGSDGEVTLTVTRDFGRTTVRSPHTAPARAGDTVMRLLGRGFDVTTRYGGGFVQSVDGISGGREDDKPVDWFYYVNGLEASTGAAQRRVSAGDRIWWDHHDWGAAQRVGAVVGSFPEPFLTGQGGHRFPIRLVCLGADTQRSCDEVETRLESAGVDAIGRSRLPQSVGRSTLRVLVGTWLQVRHDVASQTLERGPATSGVFARPSRDGGRIALLDPDGKVSRTLGADSGLIAATTYNDQGPTWVVTGTDVPGVAAAAAQLQGGPLRDKFALAVSGGRGVALPVQQP